MALLSAAQGHCAGLGASVLALDADRAPLRCFLGSGVARFEAQAQVDVASVDSLSSESDDPDGRQAFCHILEKAGRVALDLQAVKQALDDLRKLQRQRKLQGHRRRTLTSETPRRLRIASLEKSKPAKSHQSAHAAKRLAWVRCPCGHWLAPATADGEGLKCCPRCGCQCQGRLA
jgi:hypothetical protein